MYNNAHDVYGLSLRSCRYLPVPQRIIRELNHLRNRIPDRLWDVNELVDYTKELQIYKKYEINHPADMSVFVRKCTTLFSPALINATAVHTKWAMTRNPPPVRYNSGSDHISCAYSINHIYDQTSCGNCWAVASVSVMTDRTCIGKKEQFNQFLSSDDVLDCCTSNGISCGTCTNGHELDPFQFWNDTGIVTGGDFGYINACKPTRFNSGCGSPCSRMDYIETDEKDNFQCTTECASGYAKHYNADKHKASEIYYIGGYYLRGLLGIFPSLRDQSTNKEEFDECLQQATIAMAAHNDTYVSWDSLPYQEMMSALKSEIQARGPIAVGIPIFEDFYYYRSGIYSHVYGDEEMETHIVKLIGWDVLDGVEYWIAANTWGTDWGENGKFHLRMYPIESSTMVQVTFKYALAGLVV